MVDEVPFTDIYVDEEIVDRVSDVLRGKRWVKGPEVRTLEREFAAVTGTEHAIGVSSGTSAIFVALDALGIEEGDEVFVPGHTFFATVSPVLALGATPVFVDIDPDMYTMNPADLQAKVSSSEQPTAILPVHIYGQVTEMDPILEIANKRDLAVVEDACQAHHAQRKGDRAGTFGDIGCFSFYPSKNMAVGGDGGMIVTDDDTLAQTARVLRNHGRDDNGDHIEVGLNHRLDEMKGAIGQEQLKRLPEWSERRAAAAARYTERLEDVPEVTTPTVPAENRHVYHLYVIQVPDRDSLRETLLERNIEVGIHYETPAHRHEAVIERVGTEELPVTETLVDRILSLPMHPRITDEEIQYVCDAIAEHYGES